MTATPLLHDLWSEANWLEWRARAEAFTPIRMTPLVTTPQSRGEFIEGARLLRLDKRQRAGDGGYGPSPMQLLVADVLAAGRFMNVIFEPRRSTKTTAVQAVLLGRCAHREDYRVGWTMFTTGLKVGERFRDDIVQHLERLYPDPRLSPIVVNKGKGYESLLFRDTSAKLSVYAPNADGFRSGGFDAAFGDEAAEADVEQGEDVTRAVIPTMDTKIGAQFILAGTGQKWRTGNLMWENLHDDEAAIAWHGIPETVDRRELVSWEPDLPHPKTGATGGRMREFIQLHHPGVGYTTPLEAPKRSFDKVSLDDFLLEYGGQFGFEGAADVLIPPAQLASAWTDEPFPAEMPARMSVAFKAHHLGTHGSLAVAWEYDEPSDLVSDALALVGEQEKPARRAVALWWWDQSLLGVDNALLTRMRRTRAPLVYDKRGYTEEIVERGKLARAVPKVTVKPTKTSDIPVSTVGLLRALEHGTLVMFRHPALEKAASIATRQAFGNYGTFRFGAPKDDPEADVTPIEAAALALLYLDDAPRPIDPASTMEFA